MDGDEMALALQLLSIFSMSSCEEFKVLSEINECNIHYMSLEKTNVKNKLEINTLSYCKATKKTKANTFQ